MSTATATLNDSASSSAAALRLTAPSMVATSGITTIETPKFENVTQLLERAVDDNVFPGAVLVASRNGEVVYRKAVGQRSIRRGDENAPMTVDTVFDIASLTSLIVTTTLIMRLLEGNKLRLDDKVSRYIQGFGVHGKSSISIAQLLTHTSGLPHWTPFFEELLKENSGNRMGIMTSRAAKGYIINSINRSQIKVEPGSKQIFSDLGLILLGHIAEILTGLPLDRAAHKFIFQPLGIKSTSYIDLAMIKRRGIHPVTDIIAPTEECPWRKRMLCGEVHDDNAWAMGGIAGHAGVFSTASDMQVFAMEMLRAYRGQSPLIAEQTVKYFWNGNETLNKMGAWRYGWDTPSTDNLFDGVLPETAVGMCGFTGCSLWIEPKSGTVLTLMSNRVHPSRSNKKIRGFRPELFAAVLKAVNS